MYITYLKYFIFFAVLLVVQLVVVPLISIENIAPNIPLVLLIFLTLNFGQLFGTIAGFIFGLSLDVFSGGPVGAFMFTFTLSGFITGYFYNENKIASNTSSYFFSFIVILIASFNSFLYATIASTSSDLSFVFLVVEEGLLPGFYTAVFSLPVVLFNPRKDLG